MRWIIRAARRAFGRGRAAATRPSRRVVAVTSGLRLRTQASPTVAIRMGPVESRGAVASTISLLRSLRSGASCVGIRRRRSYGTPPTTTLARARRRVLAAAHQQGAARRGRVSSPLSTSAPRRDAHVCSRPCTGLQQAAIRLGAGSERGDADFSRRHTVRTDH